MQKTCRFQEFIIQKLFPEMNKCMFITSICLFPISCLFSFFSASLVVGFIVSFLYIWFIEYEYQLITEVQWAYIHFSKYTQHFLPVYCFLQFQKIQRIVKILIGSFNEENVTCIWWPPSCLCSQEPLSNRLENCFIVASIASYSSRLCTCLWNKKQNLART